jgi:hypothetical protein
MGFNVLGSYNEGFEQGRERKEYRAKEEQGKRDVIEKARLRTQAEAALEGGEHSEAFRQTAIDQTDVYKNLSNLFKTDETGVDALMYDMKHALYWMDVNEPGNAKQIMENRLVDIGRMTNSDGSPKDGFQTQAMLKMLEDDPEGAHQNLQKFVDMFGGEGKKDKFEKGTKGLVFNKQTGTFTVDPIAKARFDEIAKKAVIDGGLSFKDRQSLNKDVTGMMQKSIEIRKAAAELDKLKGRGTAAAKLGAVFKFMKALDPSSVVRKEEQGQVYSAQGVASGMAGTINGLLGKGQLTEAGFLDLVNTAKTIANSNSSSTGTEVNALLASFEDTIPESFKLKVIERVPTQFKIKGSSALYPIPPEKNGAGEHVSSGGISFTVGG